MLKFLIYHFNRKVCVGFEGPKKEIQEQFDLFHNWGVCNNEIWESNNFGYFWTPLDKFMICLENICENRFIAKTGYELSGKTHKERIRKLAEKELEKFQREDFIKYNRRESNFTVHVNDCDFNLFN